METWTTELIKSQVGKTYLITGGTDGIRLDVARGLCRSGARVILCTEDLVQGEAALLDVLTSVADAQISFELVDFADLSGVKKFAEKFMSEHKSLNLLVHSTPTKPYGERATSAQGLELTFAKNYLAHFALTAHLFPLLKQSVDSRVVFQISPEHEKGVIDFFDLDATHFYESKKAYSQAQLAVLIFAKELDRRLRETKVELKSIAVQGTGSSLLLKLNPFRPKVSADLAAWPTLFAATSGEAQSGSFYGISGGLGKRHRPCELDTPLNAKNILSAEKLWDISCELSGVEFSIHNMSNILPFHMRENIEPELFT